MGRGVLATGPPPFRECLGFISEWKFASLGPVFTFLLVLEFTSIACGGSLLFWGAGPCLKAVVGGDLDRAQGLGAAVPGESSGLSGTVSSALTPAEGGLAICGHE